MIISVDLGYGWTKGISGNSIFRQPSLLGEPKNLFEEQVQEGDLIFTGTEGKYFVGDLALRHSDVKYSSIKENKAEAWVTEVMLKAALGFLSQHKDLYLMTGLPIDFYFSQKESVIEMLQRFNSSDSFEIESTKQFRTNIKPIIRQFKIVPQPLGTAMNYLLNDEGEIVRVNEAKKRLLIIDIGYYTLDLLILDGMEIHKSSCSPPELGVDTAYRLLQGYLKEKTGKAPSRSAMDRYVLNNEFEGYDISPLIQKAFKALASQVQNEVDSLNMNFATTIITGGSASYLSDFLDVPNKQIMNEPQLANVIGYEKMGRRIWTNGNL